MSHFNQKTEPVRNVAGGIAYKESDKMQLVSLLLTSFGDDKYYESSNKTYQRLAGLMAKIDPMFSAKAIVYARKVFGMRTITHLAASLLAARLSGQNARAFFRSVIKRPDDITEIISCHLGRNQKISNAMKKGFSDAFGQFDAYQMAKYRGEGKKVKLVDVLNLCHPKPTEKSMVGQARLVAGNLVSEATWESKLSAAGKDPEKKKAAWRELLEGGRLGYFALLRNLRNISMLGDVELEQLACRQLVNPEAIRKSLVLPFRFATAFENISAVSGRIKTAISQAADIALSNMPKFEGKTLVCLDVSGSMRNVSTTAAMFAAAMMKANDADLVTFDESARYKYVNPADSLLTIMSQLRFSAGGTAFNPIFDVVTKKYDRIFLLSDMQAWKAKVYNWRTGTIDLSPSAAYNKYKRTYSPECKMYSFDLAGYGTLQLPEKDVFCLAGFSEKIFDVLKAFDNDPDALLTTIEQYSL